MKFPLAAATIAILAAGGIAKVAYDLKFQEKCDVSVAYELPRSSPATTESMSVSTQTFATEMGYKFLPSSLDGQLTLFGPMDKDRLIIVFNTEGSDRIKVSFYDCRKGGSGAAIGNTWMQTIGRRFLQLNAT